MKKIVFFDLDGTISDSGQGIINGLTYAQEKLNLRKLSLEEKRSCIGPPFAPTLSKLWNVSFEEAEHIIDVYREYYTVTGIYENYLYPGIEDLLKFITDNGFEARICSAKPLKMVKTVLEHFKIDKYFATLTGAEMHGKYPGKGILIEQILKETGAQAMMIGDRSDDIEGGKHNNIPSIGVLWGYGSEEELKNAGADYLVTSTDEIKEIIKKVFK